MLIDDHDLTGHTKQIVIKLYQKSILLTITSLHKKSIKSFKKSIKVNNFINITTESI